MEEETALDEIEENVFQRHHADEECAEEASEYTSSIRELHHISLRTSISTCHDEIG